VVFHGFWWFLYIFKWFRWGFSLIRHGFGGISVVFSGVVFCRKIAKSEIWGAKMPI